jgi:hypothetical protein
MTKKHSVHVSFEEADYKQLRDLADKEDRKINAQARHMLRKVLNNPISSGRRFCCSTIPGEPHGSLCVTLRPDTSPHFGAQALTAKDREQAEAKMQEPRPG